MYKVIILLVLAVTLVTACATTNSQNVQDYSIIHAKELLLDHQAFPSAWQVNSCEPSCERRERIRESARSFGRVGLPGKVIQDVFVFPTNGAAEQFFQSEQEAYFAPRTLPDVTLTAATQIEYRGSADQYAIGCDQQQEFFCRAVLRYGNYVIKFYLDIDAGYDNGLQLADIAPILRATDLRVAQKLSVPSPYR